MDVFKNVVQTPDEVADQFAGVDRGIMTGGTPEVLAGVPMSAEEVGMVPGGSAADESVYVDPFDNSPRKKIVSGNMSM
jgi:hypothetical protein